MLRALLIGSLAAIGGLGTTTATAQDQRADPDFDTKVAAPTYTSQHPAVLFDEAHHNLHTADGLYKPFADLIGHDGYRVASNKKPLSRALLDGYQILIIANAAAAEGEGPRAAGTALRDVECKVVEALGHVGRLPPADHRYAPVGAAARNLADRFGVEMSQGVTIDPKHSVPGKPGRLIFTGETGLLGDHPITRGRHPSERIHRVVTYAGQSLLGPRGSVPFLRLSETAIDRVADHGNARASDRCQGLAMTHGKGRVVVLGEAGALSAQIDPGGRFGMNDPGNDNRQLALNVMHWLSRALPADPPASPARADWPRRSGRPNSSR